MIELMVVIAIIVILMSLLFPVIQGAREKAQSSTCKSNLKQLAVAAMNYEADNDGFMPRPFGRWPGNSAEEWYNALATYSGVGTNAVVAQSIWTCPTQYRLKPGRTTYSMNHQITMQSADPGNTATPPSDNQTRPISRGLMLRPGATSPAGRWPVGAATIPYFMDGSCRNTSYFEGWRTLRHQLYYADEKQPYRRWAHPHGDYGCNLVFLDGHVETMNYGEGIFEHYDWPSDPLAPRYDDGGVPF